MWGLTIPPGTRKIQLEGGQKKFLWLEDVVGNVRFDTYHVFSLSVPYLNFFILRWNWTYVFIHVIPSYHYITAWYDKSHTLSLFVLKFFIHRLRGVCKSCKSPDRSCLCLSFDRILPHRIYSRPQEEPRRICNVRWSNSELWYWLTATKGSSFHRLADNNSYTPCNWRLISIWLPGVVGYIILLVSRNPILSYFAVYLVAV